MAACFFPKNLYTKNYAGYVNSFGVPPLVDSAYWLIQQPWRATVKLQMLAQWRLDFSSGAIPPDFDKRVEKAIQDAARAQKPVSNYILPLFDEWYTWFLVIVPFNKVFGRRPDASETESWCQSAFQSQNSAEVAMRKKREEVEAAAAAKKAEADKKEEEKRKIEEARKAEWARMKAAENARKNQVVEAKRQEELKLSNDAEAKRLAAEAEQRKIAKQAEDALAAAQKEKNEKVYIGVGLAITAIVGFMLLRRR